MKTRLSIPDQTAHLAVLVCALLLAAPAAHAQVGDARAEVDDHFGFSVARGDFNGDGYQDLAVGVPFEDINDPFSTISDAGAVEVFYGTARGLDWPNRQFWHQDSADVEDVGEQQDEFGFSLAAGDFNGDGYDDLAIGVPLETVGSNRYAGAVNVLFGSPAGLSATDVPDQFWHQNSSGVQDTAERGDLFGYSLAAGDFNRDGYDDLAIGVRGETVGSTADAGAVNVLYGSSTGLSATAVPNQFWHQDSANVEDVAEATDYFGLSLAAGDFNGDGYDDLGIGVYLEDIGDITAAGAVHILHGSRTGLSATVVPDQFWHQDSADVQDVAEDIDYFGASLAAGDFNGDGYDDLAIGVHGEKVGSLLFEGAVNVLYGSPAGLSATAVPDQFWHQDSAGVQDVAEGYDNFGDSLAAGDFNGDGRDDLAIGVTREGVGNIGDAGAVNVLYGYPTGLSATDFPDQFWHQDVADVEGTAAIDDGFGASLAAGDFNGDGRDDLAIGVPGEDLWVDGPIVNAGAVNVLYGAFLSGLSATIVPDQFWTQTYTLPPMP